MKARTRYTAFNQHYASCQQGHIETVRTLVQVGMVRLRQPSRESLYVTGILRRVAVHALAADSDIDRREGV